MTTFKRSPVPLYFMPGELEICIACDDERTAVENGRAAAQGGANRLECCAVMASGGLTPDPAIIEAICRSVPEHVDVLAMIRPRDGNFEWSAPMASRMLQTIKDMAAAGAHGVVSGALRRGMIDRELTSRLIAESHDAGLKFTFHRAVDDTLNRRQAMDTLHQLGCDRVLTSGTEWASGKGALEGLVELQAVKHLLKDRMELVVGGGISAHSLKTLLPVFGSQSRISYHAYSSVLSGNRTSADRVRDLRDLVDNAGLDKAST